MSLSRQKSIEQAIIHDIRINQKELRVALLGLKNEPGTAARVFSLLAQAGINVNLIVQNMTGRGADWADLSFTVPSASEKALRKVLDQAKKEKQINDYQLHSDQHLLVIEGDGMQTHTDIAARIFERLGKAAINIEMICTSELEISCAVSTAASKASLEMLREEFQEEIKAGAYPSAPGQEMIS